MIDSTTDTMATDSAIYKTLLESTKAIPWRIDWKTMQFTYIGPQIEALLGWSQHSWVSAQDWAERIHSDERDKTVNFCISQSEAGVDHEADYRALTADGNYIWIRDVVHVVRDDEGAVEALIGFMFDISERKKTEQELVSLKQELENLSLTDSLTGVGNRRRFNAVLEEEWNHARRNQQPLSLIMLDIDFFKQYNDHYGHLRGDDCLMQVAKALSGAAKRTKDFFGRFGGEEFMLVLPETDEAAAKTVADRCRQLILKEQIIHANSPVGQLLTISLGVATIIPNSDDDPLAFVESVDRLLYRAKQQGRNQVVCN